MPRHVREKCGKMYFQYSTFQKGHNLKLGFEVKSVYCRLGILKPTYLRNSSRYHAVSDIQMYIYSSEILVAVKYNVKDTEHKNGRVFKSARNSFNQSYY